MGIRESLLWCFGTLAATFALAVGAYIVGRMFTTGKQMALKRWREGKRRERSNHRPPNNGPHFPRKYHQD